MPDNIHVYERSIVPLDPDLAALLREFLPAADNGGQDPDWAARFADMIRSSYAKEPVAATADILIDGRPARIYRPTSPTPVPTMLYVHGGGWSSGDIDAVDSVARQICIRLPSVVVSVSYRLAPEFPFPCAFDDVCDALRWCYRNIGSLGNDPTRQLIGGDSAGGNLAAAAALDSRSWASPPLAGQLLINPATDLDPAASPTASWISDSDPRLKRDGTVAAMRAYLNGQIPDDWRASPVRADLTGAPAAVVVLAGYDILHDDGALYAQALANCGVPTRIVDCESLVHGFSTMAHLVPAADTAVKAYVDSLRSLLLSTGQ